MWKLEKFRFHKIENYKITDPYREAIKDLILDEPKITNLNIKQTGFENN